MKPGDYIITVNARELRELEKAAESLSDSTYFKVVTASWVPPRRSLASIPVSLALLGLKGLGALTRRA